MSLQNLTLAAAATVTTTGGTSLAFAEDAVQIQNGIHLIVPADSNFLERRQMTAKVKVPTFDVKTNKYSKGKRSISITAPKVLSDGTTVFNVVRAELEMHPSMTEADALELLKLAAQCATLESLKSFWINGTLRS